MVIFARLIQSQSLNKGVKALLKRSNMHISQISLMALIGGLSLAMATPASAQSTYDLDQPRRKIIRKVEPIPYWVEADQLSIRDNPVAGNVVGMLELGKKVKAYETFENWVRISPEGDDSLWINTKYLTNTEVTWTNYDSKAKSKRFSRANSSTTDIVLKRIRVPDNKSARLHATSIRTPAENEKLIVTRQTFRSGPFFMKHQINCQDKDTPEIKFLGEGFNYVMMERHAKLNAARAKTVSASKALERSTVPEYEPNATVKAIGNFACKYRGKNF